MLYFIISLFVFINSFFSIFLLFLSDASVLAYIFLALMVCGFFFFYKTHLNLYENDSRWTTNLSFLLFLKVWCDLFSRHTLYRSLFLYEICIVLFDNLFFLFQNKNVIKNLKLNHLVYCTQIVINRFLKIEINQLKLSSHLKNNYIKVFDKTLFYSY